MFKKGKVKVRVVCVCGVVWFEVLLPFNYVRVDPTFMQTDQISSPDILHGSLKLTIVKLL